MHTCVYSGEDKRTNIDDIFFLRSRLHLTATTVLIKTVLIATTIETRTTKQKQEHIIDVVIALARASLSSKRASERTKQEESSCLAFLKAIILFIIRHVDIRTHTHTNGSVNQCFACVAKTSRALLLSIHQHQTQ